MLLPDLKFFNSSYCLRQYNKCLGMKYKVLHNLAPCLTLQPCLWPNLIHHPPTTMNYLLAAAKMYTGSQLNTFIRSLSWKCPGCLKALTPSFQASFLKQMSILPCVLKRHLSLQMFLQSSNDKCMPSANYN